MTNIGIIGAGHWSTPYALAAESAGGNVCCIYAPDESAAALAKRVGSKTAANASEVFESADCVLIGAPTDAHPELLKLASQSGKPTLCASPSAANATQVAALREFTSAPIYSSFPFRVRPEYQKLKSAMDSGDLGTIGMIRIGICLARPQGWRADVSRSGGSLIDSGVHALDLLQWLGGDIKRVYGAGSREADMQYNLLMARTASDSIAHLEISWVETAGNAFEYYEVSGSNGLLDYDTRREPILVLERHEQDRPEMLFPGATAAEHELTAFLAAVKKGGADFPTLSHGLDMAELALQVADAVQKGSVLTL